MDELRDGYGRIIDYLRISLTDRCNLRCSYCMPECGIIPAGHDEILSFEEILRIVRILSDMGIRRVRFTGGEPFVRRDLIKLINMISDLDNAPKVALTTNGVLLSEYIDELGPLGVKDINISLDTLRPDVFLKITGKDELDAVLRSIEASYEAGMNVKINCVPIEGLNKEDIIPLACIARDKNIKVRFIELMPIGCGMYHKGISSGVIRDMLAERFGKGVELQSDKSEVRGPARYIGYDGFTGKIGFIDSLSHEFCSSCNRLRLTSDGKLKFCLYSPEGPDIKKMMRSGQSDNAIKKEILSSVVHKPAAHRFVEVPEQKSMVMIGG